MRQILLLTILLSTLNALGQPSGRGQWDPSNMPKEGEVKGQVFDDADDNPLEFANIMLYSMKDSSLVAGAIADQEGKFHIKEVPYGRYTLQANFIGYEKYEMSDIKLFPKNKIVNVGEIKVLPSVQQLEEVEVTAEMLNVDYQIDKKVIAVSKDLNAAGGTAVDVLTNVPSVNVDIEGNVSVRGSSNFTVFIDGKPSALTGSDALQQIPSATIDKIEVITNPSAKYDPDGVGGIINVVTKKNKLKGIAGSVDLTAGTRNKYQGSAILSYKTKKWDFNTSFDYRDMRFYGDNTTNRVSLIDDTTFFVTTSGEGFRLRGGNNFKFGTSYAINDKSSIGLNATIGKFIFEFNSEEDQEEFSTPESTTIDVLNKSILRRERDFYTVDLNYDYNFGPGHSITTYLFYRNRDGVGLDLQENYLNSDGSFDNGLRSDERSKEDEFRAKVDYTRAIKENKKLEAGYQLREEKEFSDYELYTVGSEGEVVRVPEFDGEMDYRRTIHGAYATFSAKTPVLDYQLGLRTEYTNRVIESPATEEAAVVNRMDWFPTLHLSKGVAEGQDLYASYSRRIRRPRGWYLDPFPRFQDQFNVRQGNPELLPEYLDSYELGYQWRVKKSFISIEGYYRQTNGAITRIQQLNEETNIIVHTFENLDREMNSGVEIMWNFNPAKWFNMNLTGNLYHFQVKGSVNSETVDRSSTNYSSRSNFTFILSKVSRVQLNGMYFGPSASAQGETRGAGMLNVSYKHSFLEKKLAATVQFRNILNTMNRAGTSFGPNFVSEREYEMESPIVQASVSYTFNNYRKKRSRGGGPGGDDMGMGF